MGYMCFGSSVWQFFDDVKWSRENASNCTMNRVRRMVVEDGLCSTLGTNSIRLEDWQ